MRQKLRVALLVTLSVASMRAANIVTNGSFEDPDIPTGTYQLFSSISGWSLGSGSDIELQDNVAGSPFEGQQILELDSTANSSIYQDLTTTLGNYTLSFAFSPRPGTALNSMQVFWAGSLLATVSESGTGLTDNQWTVYNYNVTASETTTRLQFTSVGPSDSFGEYIDAVSVESVPEPASIWLSLSGLALIAGFYQAFVRTHP